MNHIAFIPFDGEPFGKLVYSRPVERQLHNRLMTLRVEEQLPLPPSNGAYVYFESITILKRSKNNIFPPWPDGQAFCFPEAVHNCGTREISVAVPSFDDAIRFLHVPHHFDLAIYPLHSRIDRLTIIKVYGAFD